MRAALTSTAAGIAVTAVGVVALVAILGARSSAEPTVVLPATTAVAPLSTAIPSTTAAPGESLVVAVPSPTPDLAGVGSAVARVLYANGYATNNEPGELADDLPAAVLALLIEREVTLTIATEPADLVDQEVTP